MASAEMLDDAVDKMSDVGWLIVAGDASGAFVVSGTGVGECELHRQECESYDASGRTHRFYCFGV